MFCTRTILPAMVVIAGTTAFGVPPVKAEQPAPLVLKAVVPLPDATGRMDHLAIDVKGHRLFMSAIGNGGSEVVDIATNKYMRTIPGFKEPQGEYYDEGTNLLFVANGGNGEVDVINGKTYEKVGAADFKMDADDMRWDPYKKVAVVGYSGQKFVNGHPITAHGGEGDGALGWISPDGKHYGVLAPVAAHPEAYEFEKTNPKVYINDPDNSDVEVADTNTHKTITTWPVPCGDNFSLALDRGHHRLFVACRIPPTFLVYDTNTGKIVSVVPKIDGTADDMFYDAKRHRIYLISGKGFVDVFSQKDADHYALMARIPAKIGSRTGWFSPEFSELFVSVSNPKYAAASSTIQKAGYTSNAGGSSSAASEPNELLVYKIQ